MIVQMEKRMSNKTNPPLSSLYKLLYIADGDKTANSETVTLKFR